MRLALRRSVLPNPLVAMTMNLSSRSGVRKLSISGVRWRSDSSKSSATRMSSASTVQARICVPRGLTAEGSSENSPSARPRPDPALVAHPRGIRVLSSANCTSRMTLAPLRGGVRMRKRTVIGFASLLLGSAVLVGTPALTGAQEEIRLGAFLPISGISADVGAQMKAGTEVAAERMGTLQVGGKPMKVRVIWYDDEGKGDVGLNVVTRALTVDKIHVGMGFLSSDVFIRVMDEFQKTSTPIVTCCSASLKIGEKIAQNKMQYAFQLSPTANDIARSLTAAVAMHVKPKKVALLNENTDAGRDFSRIVREWFAANAKDVEVVADEFVDRGVTDLTPQFAKIKRSGAQAIIGEIYGSSGSVLFNQWYELKVPAVPPHMGPTGSAQTFIDQNVKQTDLAIVNTRWWPAKYSEMSEPMMAAYKKKTGTDPTNFAVQAHDATVVLLEAIQKAGSLDPQKIQAALESGTFVTAWGTRKFTPLSEGHRMPVQTVIVQIQGGKKVPIYPEAVAGAAGGKFVPVPPYAWDKK